LLHSREDTSQRRSGVISCTLQLVANIGLDAIKSKIHADGSGTRMLSVVPLSHWRLLSFQVRLSESALSPTRHHEPDCPGKFDPLRPGAGWIIGSIGDGLAGRAAGAPVIALALLNIQWSGFGWPQAIGSLVLMAFVFLLADFARRRGRAIEAKVFAEMGGKPTLTTLRDANDMLDADTKRLLHHFLAGRLNELPPSPDDEANSPAACDAFYERATAWLRENTRTDQFRVLFDENITYGLRRNLFGLKGIALLLDVLVVGLCIGMLWPLLPLDLKDHYVVRTLCVLIVCGIHAFYFLYEVDRQSVFEAARQYARQLFLACETLRTTAGHT
jgi:hypothetical protein